jgi:hypothetical protein
MRHGTTLHEVLMRKIIGLAAQSDHALRVSTRALEE